MKRGNNIWVLIANSSFAEIYSIDNGHIHEIKQIHFPEGREKGADIYTDRPGRSFEGRSNVGMGVSRHAYSSEVDAHSHEQQIFAHRLADILQKGKLENAYEKLAIICPPQFLGELRHALSDAVRNSIYKEVNKDIHDSQSKQDRVEAIYRLLDLKKPVSAR